MRLHRHAARVLEDRAAREAEPSLAELAHHFVAAAPGGAADKAVHHARRAAERAVELLAYEEAARLYELALEAARQQEFADDRERCELLLGLGDAQAKAGTVREAKETFLQAADAARRLGEPGLLARAALGYGGRFVWLRAGNDRRLIPLLEDALAVQPQTDSALRARLLARLAGALRDHPEPERLAALSGEAVEIAHRLGDPATLAWALDGSYAALSWPRDTAAWLDRARELGRLAEEAGDREQAYWAHLHAFGALWVGGDVQAADAELAAMAVLAQELRQPVRTWWVAVARGMRSLFAGRIAEAERSMLNLAELRWEVEELDATFDFAITLQRWAVRRAQGRLAEVEATVESFVQQYPAMFLFRCLLASLYAELGRSAEARDQLERLAADGFSELGVGTDWFCGASLLAGVCTALGDDTHAAPLYDALLPYGGANVLSHPEVGLGSASRYLALLAATMARWDDATRHFEAALAHNERMGSPLGLAHTQQDYGEMLLQRPEPGDWARALELIGSARTTYRNLGMASWVERLPAAAESVGTVTPAGGGGR